MYISTNWLKSFINLEKIEIKNKQTSIESERLLSYSQFPTELLTLTGFEVEDICTRKIIDEKDIIVEIDNSKVESILDVSKLIAMSTSEFIEFTISRYDEEIFLKVKPNLVNGQDNLGNKIMKKVREFASAV